MVQCFYVYHDTIAMPEIEYYHTRILCCAQYAHFPYAYNNQQSNKPHYNGYAVPQCIALNLICHLQYESTRINVNLKFDITFSFLFDWAAKHIYTLTEISQKLLLKIYSPPDHLRWR